MQVRALCNKYKSLLIFDEVCTGFRISLGGAQKYYNVIPDMSTFGKAMANGFPLSAIVGKKKIMRKMTDIFYSGTFAGETSSLNACDATIDFLIKNNDIYKNKKKGLFLKKKLNFLIRKNKLEKLIHLSGHETWLFLNVKKTKNINPDIMKAFIRQELIKNKILFLGSFNITYSHTIEDLSHTIKIFDGILKFISKNLKNIEKFLYIKLPKNIFQVRKSK